MFKARKATASDLPMSLLEATMADLDASEQPCATSAVVNLDIATIAPPMRAFLSLPLPLMVTSSKYVRSGYSGCISYMSSMIS